MLLKVHSEPTLFHFVYFAGFHLGVWIFFLDSHGLTRCWGCSFKQKKKVRGWGFLWLFEYIFYFFLFCRISCVFFKCNIPKIFVFTSGSIIFFLFSLLLLLMFLQKTKLVCILWRAEICLWSVVWYRLDSSLKQARLQMWFAEILLDTTHFWCLSFREVGQQIVLVDKIRG